MTVSCDSTMQLRRAQLFLVQDVPWRYSYSSRSEKKVNCSCLVAFCGMLNSILLVETYSLK